MYRVFAQTKVFIHLDKHEGVWSLGQMVSVWFFKKLPALLQRGFLFYFIFKDFICPFSPQSPPVHSCTFLAAGPPSRGMRDAAPAWPDEQCHIRAQDSNRRNPGPPKQSSEVNHSATRPAPEWFHSFMFPPAMDERLSFLHPCQYLVLPLFSVLDVLWGVCCVSPMAVTPPWIFCSGPSFKGLPLVLAPPPPCIHSLRHTRYHHFLRLWVFLRTNLVNSQFPLISTGFIFPRLLRQLPLVHLLFSSQNPVVFVSCSVLLILNGLHHKKFSLLQFQWEFGGKIMSCMCSVCDLNQNSPQEFKGPHPWLLTGWASCKHSWARVCPLLWNAGSRSSPFFVGLFAFLCWFKGGLINLVCLSLVSQMCYRYPTPVSDFSFHVLYDFF